MPIFISPKLPILIVEVVKPKVPIFNIPVVKYFAISIVPVVILLNNETVSFTAPEVITLLSNLNLAKYNGNIVSL